mgnify:FL=1|jgi:hypothetical protein
MSEEKKVIHEVKLDKSIIKLLWVFAVVLLLNAVPKDMLIPEAFAELSPNPVIHLIVGEPARDNGFGIGGSNIMGNLDIDD